jgi:hypothetical protein
LALTAAERERVEAALPQAQLLLNPANGIVRAGIAVSKDRPGTGAIAFYIEPASNSQTLTSISAQIPTQIPTSIGGVATIVLPATGQWTDSTSGAAPPQPRAASLSQVLAVKQKVAASVLKSSPTFFGVGVGQSLDNPNDAALILFVDRKKYEGKLPDILESMGGQRLRILLMDRLHVTRSHGSTARPGAQSSCLSSQRPDPAANEEINPLDREPQPLLDPAPNP